MKHILRGTLLLLLPLLLGLQQVAAQDVQAIPKLEHRVTDLTSTLSADEQASIEARLAAFEQRKGAQIVVVLVDTTKPEDIFSYAMRLGDTWKIGRKGVDDGVILLVAKSDRDMRIHTGPGISGALTDALSKRIISEIITPRFREGQYYGGISDGVDKIIGVIDGEPLPPPPQKSPGTEARFGGQEIFAILLFFVVGIGGTLRSLFGRLFGALLTGGIAGALLGLFVSGLFGVLGGMGAFLLVLLVDLNAGGRSGRGGHGGGFGGGGWSSGGGGGGGFSGGGGGFDGGGASGKW